MTVIIGFLIGFTIPLFASRFLKFMPCDAGTALSYMFHIPKFPRWDKKLLKMWAKFLCHCFIVGIISSLMLYYLELKVGNTYSTTALSSFLFVLGLLCYVDYKTMYLPDVLTVFFLILGFYFAPDYEQSAIGAMYGYLMPTIASAFVCRFKPDSFGGGDVKILAGLGAWLGIFGVSIAILLSVFIFIFMSLLRKENAGPYGPAIGLASYLILANISLVPLIISFIAV
ncbi:MAG: Type 4 prepilin-like proteins leader peptide-processing enzyme [Alphaproteobacteria bacterium ADurb.Bin438]|nr:MAG: Type 4 prepilin-like proteins leader peptide-processing enzyme [Alphaproteobacteria bacterium ADurb.Bin438]